MTSEVSEDSGHTSDRPLLFISHRHADRAIADVLRKYVNDRSGGRIAVFQSSSAEAENARVGRELQRELKEKLWRAGAVILVFTNPKEDWAYCMWECGVATHPESPDTKIVVLQCGPHPPTVYADAVRVQAQDLVSIQKLASDFLTSPDFFPGQNEAVAPGFAANGDEVQQAAKELYEALNEVIIPGDSDEGEAWATVPFLRLQLTFAEVDGIRELDPVKGARAVLEQARVNQIDAEAKRLFGVGRVEPFAPFAWLLDAWQHGRPDSSTGWIDELAEQVRVASHWRNPQFRWQLLRSVVDSDHARYAPILSRVRSVPRERCHHFNVYFSKFDTDDDGAIRIGFVDEPQIAPGEIAVVAPSASQPAR
jgi:hypothetical protein